MAKKIQMYIKSQIAANQAAPVNLGSTLGPAGVNIMEFCKAFNAHTQDLEVGIPIPVVITVFNDRSFTFVTKKPPVSFYIKKFAGLSKGSAMPGREKVGTITSAQIREIAAEKIVDLNSKTIDATYEMIKGSALSMGVEVVE